MLPNVLLKLSYSKFHCIVRTAHMMVDATLKMYLPISREWDICNQFQSSLEDMPKADMSEYPSIS